MTLRNAKEALDALAAKIGLPGLKFGKDNACELIVGEDLEIQIEDMGEGGVIRLNAAVRDMAGTDAAVLRDLLTANFNGMGTGKAALSVNPATSEIVLTQPVEATRHDAASLVAEVELFVRYAAFWREHAAGMSAGAEDGAPAMPLGGDEVTFRP